MNYRGDQKRVIFSVLRPSRPPHTIYTTQLTPRAVPPFCRFIAANSEIKVVFNGDGSDEASGSYLYFNNAPNDAAFEAECSRLLHDIHLFDVLRSDRSISSHGEE